MPGESRILMAGFTQFNPVTLTAKRNLTPQHDSKINIGMRPSNKGLTVKDNEKKVLFRHVFYQYL